MWIDSVIEYDIIVETLTGAEIEVTVTDDDTIGYIKTHIQKYEGNFSWTNNQKTNKRKPIINAFR